MFGKRLNLASSSRRSACSLCGACVLAAAPLLFHVVLQGRYDEGLAVLPWTLAGCVWYGIYCIAQNYLWCAEKTRLATVPLGLGLVVNIVLNFVLLPTYGLHGAVLATALSTVLVPGHRACAEPPPRHAARRAAPGCSPLAPAALGFGAWPAIAACAVLAVASMATHLVSHAPTSAQLRLCRVRAGDCRRTPLALPVAAATAADHCRAS